MLVFKLGVAGDRHLAAAVEALVQRPLGAHPQRGVAVVQRLQQGMDLAVGTAAFDAHRALAAGRQAVLDTDPRADARLEAEADQAGGGEDDGVVFAGIELGQAGVDVATQELDLQVRPAGQQLRLAAQAGGADHAAGRQRVEAGEIIRDEGVARVLALADAVQAEALGEVHRHVLHRVHGDVRLVLQQRGLQFLDEQALAADLRQRRVEQLVAAADHRHQADAQPRMGRLETGFDVFGLPQGQGTLAGGDADLAGHDHFRKR
ncbi:hypothetical protein D9M69_386050 [compost metagenome]